MKILVGIKRVVDYNVRIRVRSDGSGIESDGVKMSINPFDEIAFYPLPFDRLHILQFDQGRVVCVIMQCAGQFAGGHSFNGGRYQSPPQALVKARPDISCFM